MKTIRMILTRALLMPFALLMGVGGDVGASTTDDAESAGTGYAGRPDNITEEEWEDLSEGEREAVLMDGTGEEGGYIDGDDDGDEEDLTAEELALIAGEVGGAGDDAAGTIASGDVAEGTAAPEVTTAATPADVAALMGYRPEISQADILDRLPDIPFPAEVQAKIDNLTTKFEDGDDDGNTITLAEYNKQLMALQNEGNKAIRRAELNEIEKIRGDLTWDKVSQKFMTAFPEYNGTSIEGKMRQAALNAAINSMENAGELSDMQLLIEADKLVRKSMGMSAREAAGQKSAATAPAKPSGKPPATRPTVQTLSNVPAAHGNDVGDPFAALDRLSGVAYENAIERLTPEQRDAYLARA